MDISSLAGAMGWAALCILITTIGMLLTLANGWKFYSIVILGTAGASYAIHAYAVHIGAVEIEAGWLVRILPFVFFITIHAGALAWLYTWKSNTKTELKE